MAFKGTTDAPRHKAAPLCRSRIWLMTAAWRNPPMPRRN